MSDRIQFRRDTAARWAQFNPFLLEGEIGVVLDNPNQYKVGDGVHYWNDLPLRGFNGNVVDEPGQSESAVMSQKAVTDFVNANTSYLLCISNAGDNKVVQNDGFVLNSGIRLLIKMQNTNTKQSNVTLQVGITAATPLIYNGAAVTDENTWGAGEVLDVYYNGSNYIATPYLNVDNELVAGSENLVKSGVVSASILNSTSKIGINGTFDVDNASTDFVVDIRGLETGAYCVSLKINTVTPYNIKCYRTEGYKSGIIDSSKYTINTAGAVLEIEKTTETNYLWFFVAQTYTYSAKFYIVKKEYLYEKIMGSIDGINQSISEIGSDVDSIEGNINTIQEDISNLGDDIDNINSKINYFHPSVIVDTELPIYRTDEHCFITSSGATASFNSYDVKVYSIADIQKVKITGRGGYTTVRVYAFYNSDVLGTSTLVGTVGPEQTTNYDYEVNVPTGAVYMACTKYKDQTLLSVTHEELQSDKKTVKEIKVENGNKVTISVPSNNKKLYMVIGPTETGVGNGLIDFRYWGYAPLQSGVEASPIQLYDSTSDCFAPFQIMAINNIDGDDTDNIYFTGGSHQYNNAITGATPTARLGNVEILVDRVKQTSFSGNFTTFEMTWENYIQATNTRKADGTGREVLKEIISLKYVDGEFKCCTELVPLEDITLHLFYGYQICGINPGGAYSITDHWKYVNGANREIDELTSGNKDAMAMIGDSATFHQEMWVDTNIDLGKRELCANNLTMGAFKSGSGSKGYFTIANNNSTLYKDYHYFLYGKYVFALKTIS